MDQLLLLYSHCIIVKGASRSVICDLQRRKIYPVPHSLISLFTEERYINVPEILIQLDDDEKEIFHEYLEFIEEHEFAFYCSSEEIELFPRMSEEWLFPAHISHCILDAEQELSYFNTTFLEQLEALCCNFIQFRFFKEASWNELERIMSIIAPSQVKSVEIMLPYKNEDLFYQSIESFVKKHKKISSLTITGTDVTKVYKEGNYGIGYILQTDKIIDSEIHCGVIDSSLFSINIATFTESLAFNTCLNRKIGIDTKGYIKNCPSMKKSFGHIKDTALADAVAQPDFKKYWTLAKDSISKCKDCEFRHVCTDCRAYLDEPANIYSAPLKCGYDPYTNTWEEWSSNPLKEKAVHYYQMQEMTPNI